MDISNNIMSSDRHAHFTTVLIAASVALLSSYFMYSKSIQSLGETASINNFKANDVSTGGQLKEMKNQLQTTAIENAELKEKLAFYKEKNDFLLSQLQQYQKNDQ